MASWTQQSQDLVKSLSPWKQIYRVPHFASLHKSPHTSKKCMGCTSGKIPRCLTKHMKDSQAYHAHINHGKNDKYLFAETDLTITSHSPLPTAFRASRWTQRKMMQWDEMMSSLRRTFWYAICPKRSYGWGDTAWWTWAYELGFREKVNPRFWI